MAGTPTFNSSRTYNRVKGLIGYDWHADWEARSTSLSPLHDNITEPIKVFMSATHNSIGNDNQANIKIAKNLLIDLAKADTLYDSIGFYEVIKKPLCYANGDINAPCWYHQYEFARGVFSNYMITALWLRDELNEQEFKIVDQYIKKMYKKFLKPIESRCRFSCEEDEGFYQMANGGTSILVYASWTNNTKLAAEEINFRFKLIDMLFYEDGYINDNSFRGVRAQWYHTYGLDIALGYVYIADLWGAEIPKKLQKKLVKASEVANLAITDYETFRSRPFSGDWVGSSNPKDAKKHTHQVAFAIDTLMKIVTGVELEHDTVYLDKRKYHAKDGIDDLIGFNPNCTLEALALEQQSVEDELAAFEAELVVETSDSDPTVSKVIEMIHGDTFIVDIAEPHELAGSNIKLIIRDANTPDATKSCSRQMELGIKVKDIVTQKLADASSIKLKNFRKTSTAVIAQVIVDGKDLGEELIAKGYASNEYGHWKAYFCSALQAMAAGDANWKYGGTVDADKAIFWYERAIFLDPDRDQKLVIYDLSELYSIKGDNDKSIDYLKQSANLGYMQAEEALGAAYMYGTGVKKDTSEAKYWLKKAHEHGSDSAEDICGCKF